MSSRSSVAITRFAAAMAACAASVALVTSVCFVFSSKTSHKLQLSAIKDNFSNISASMHARLAVQIAPARENARSHGTLVPGMQSTRRHQAGQLWIGMLLDF